MSYALGPAGQVSLQSLSMQSCCFFFYASRKVPAGTWRVYPQARYPRVHATSTGSHRYPPQVPDGARTEVRTRAGFQVRVRVPDECGYPRGT